MIHDTEATKPSPSSEQHSDRSGVKQVFGEDANLPTVLACGYRQIRIPKSGLTFPTFLVSLPNKKHTVWRSKRDFLLLRRVSSTTFPKAALRKLAENVPWRRPNVDVLPSCCLGPNNQYQVFMKKSVLQLDQFLKDIEAAAASSYADQKGLEAWEVFCRPEDTEGLVGTTDPEKSCKESSLESPTNIISSQLQSSRLGQYFCSEDNAKHVVETAMDKIKLFVGDQGSHPLMFLEPSCGHGGIVSALVEELEKGTIPPHNISILGYDIDPNAIRTCEKLPLPTTEYPIVWKCQNFLDTSKSTHNKEMSTSKPPIIICLGGPPYTTGAGLSSGIRRDLPTQFINHALQEWDASVICFLLPARYRDSTAIPLPPGFHCETIDLQSSTFFFQGAVSVTQPSIIQCFYLSSSNSSHAKN
jgi:hypothetical protein